MEEELLCRRRQRWGWCAGRPGTSHHDVYRSQQRAEQRARPEQLLPEQRPAGTKTQPEQTHRLHVYLFRVVLVPIFRKTEIRKLGVKDIKSADSANIYCIFCCKIQFFK